MLIRFPLKLNCRCKVMALDASPTVITSMANKVYQNINRTAPSIELRNVYGQVSFGDFEFPHRKTNFLVIGIGFQVHHSHAFDLLDNSERIECTR